jgi:hypothetical protein
LTDHVTVGFINPGAWSACFGNSLLDLLFFDAANKARILGHARPKIENQVGAAQIDIGRNDVVETFLDTESDWLLFIDADMGYAADTVERLIEAAHPTERPIVGALCFAQKSTGSGELYARRYHCTPTIYQCRETDTEIGFLPLSTIRATSSSSATRPAPRVC